MGLWAKVRRVVQTAVNDLLSEESEPTPAAGSGQALADLTAAQIQELQKRLDSLKNDLALALVREKQAENIWRTAQAQGQPAAAEWEEQHRAFGQTITALQAEIERLQVRLAVLSSQSAHLAAREENVALRERLHTLQRELDKTAVTLHHELADREEQIARREDMAAAREEVRAAGRDVEM